jgi:peptidoglycan/LPS O-acetylase OafA/YrhL
VWLAGGIGLLGCVAAFVLGFIPPSQLKTGNPAGYVALLALAVVVLSVPPFVLGVRSQAGRRAEPAAAPAQ